MGFDLGAKAFREPCAWWLWLTFLVAGVLQIGAVGSLVVVPAIKAAPAGAGTRPL